MTVERRRWILALPLLPDDRMNIGTALAIAVMIGGCDDETVVAAGDVTTSMVATSTSQEGWAMNYPKQRKLLFMAGALWIFYSDGEAFWTRTTTDGVTLTDPIQIRDDAVFGHRMGCAFDGVYFHYAFSGRARRRQCCSIGAESRSGMARSSGRPTSRSRFRFPAT